MPLSAKVVIDFGFGGFYARILFLFAINNTNYFGCDYGTCYFTCAKGYT
jgi:D-lyxose ketol-isomerase